jgi:hypothetical protein
VKIELEMVVDIDIYDTWNGNGASLLSHCFVVASEYHAS